LFLKEMTTAMNEENDRIARLISRHLLGKLNPEEEQALQAWRETNEANRKLYDDCVSGAGYEERSRLYRSIDWQTRFERFEHITGHYRRIRRQILRYASAAAIVLITVGIWYSARTPQTMDATSETIRPGHTSAVLTRSTGESFVLEKSPIDSLSARLPEHVRLTDSMDQLVYTDANTETAVENRLETPRGGEYRLTLSDGTFVHLNARTTLTYPESFGKDKREVHLSGEAWFEVAHEAVRPFYVITDEIRVKVYGTRFNVNTLRQDVVQTALVDGSIGITFGDSPNETLLHAGQLAEYRRADAQLSVITTDLLPFTAWKDGLFVFSGEPLSAILEKLSNWYDCSVFYTNTEVASIRFSGSMKKYEDINVILRAIEKTIDVKFTVTKKTILVSRVF
jgi:ferric-dicitrate binding protein FerR (iron transport regulator)